VNYAIEEATPRGESPEVVWTGGEKLTRPAAAAICREMYGNGHNGWSYEAIRGYLGRRGLVVGWTTVKRWSNPAACEKERQADRLRKRANYRDQHGITLPRVADEDGLLLRMRALEGAGLPATQIAAVIRLDYGVPMTRTGVVTSLRNERVAPRFLKAATS
jgi:hypothetical protein